MGSDILPNSRAWMFMAQGACREQEGHVEVGVFESKTRGAKVWLSPAKPFLQSG